MKTTMIMVAALPLALALAACSGREAAPVPETGASASSGDVVTEFTAADLPAGVTSTVLAAVPGMTIIEAERKERDGRVYFDVEGTRPDGSEVELDLLQEGDGFKVVEIQRDIAWNDAPAAVRTAAEGAAHRIAPVRVIESAQTDGTIIYELFADGKPDKPSLEVRLRDGKADVLTEEWPH